MTGPVTISGSSFSATGVNGNFIIATTGSTSVVTINAPLATGVTGIEIGTSTPATATSGMVEIGTNQSSGIKVQANPDIYFSSLSSASNDMTAACPAPTDVLMGATCACDQTLGANEMVRSFPVTSSSWRCGCVDNVETLSTYCLRTQSNSPPVITSISPASADVAGAATIVGTGFLTGATAKIGGTACTTSTLVSNTEILCLGIPNLAGTQNVTVTNSDTQVATLTNGFTYQTGQGTWTAGSGTNAPTTRYGHSSVWNGQVMIVWGGWTGAAMTNTGGVYDPIANTWNTAANLHAGTNAPSGRTLNSALWDGKHMIVWGGWDGTNRLNTGGFYDPLADTWTSTTTTNAPSIRSEHTAVWSGTRMLIFGGNSGTSRLNTGGSFDVYSGANGAWATGLNLTAGTNAPSPRSDHSAVQILSQGTVANPGARMAVWGGYDGTNYKNSGGIYEPVGDAWTSITTTNAPSPRSLHTAVWNGSSLIVWGGYDGTSPLFTGGIYNYSSATWTGATSTANAPSGRYLHSAIWAGQDTLMIWGGYPATNSGGFYSVASNNWTPLTANANTPSARYNHTAVWTGYVGDPHGGLQYVSDNSTQVAASSSSSGRVVIFGGNTGASALNDVYTLDILPASSNNWIMPTNTTGAPGQVYLHTALWTGSQMIVWGGENHGGTALNTGSLYDPAADSWSAISTGTNVPTKRFEHVAVWTGNKMIIWGGQVSNAASRTNTGSIYDLSTDSWVAMTTTGAPSGRALLGGVWTGNKLVVYGGRDAANNRNNSGGIYYPGDSTTAENWTATSTGANVPNATFSASTIWTGKYVVAWGGNDGSPETNTGGVFDPNANSWIHPISTGANSPQPRVNHVVLWTGQYMMIWSGNNNSTYLNDGGLYDPVGDTWPQAITTTGAPGIRESSTGVWTGDTMLVWSGNRGGTEVGTGGAYTPSSNSWTTISAGGNVPTARDTCTAVWTGSRMILWGGTTNGGAGQGLNTGAQYVP